LENLEERALLSTYTLWEGYTHFGYSFWPTVFEKVDNKPPTPYPYLNPQHPFKVITGGLSNTVNILDTRVGVAIDVADGGFDTVNVGSNGSVQGILADVTVHNYFLFTKTTLNVDDSADATARAVTLSTD
jgi:hypothetical protein